MKAHTLLTKAAAGLSAVALTLAMGACSHSRTVTETTSQQTGEIRTEQTSQQQASSGEVLGTAPAPSNAQGVSAPSTPATLPTAFRNGTSCPRPTVCPTTFKTFMPLQWTGSLRPMGSRGNTPKWVGRRIGRSQQSQRPACAVGRRSISFAGLVGAAKSVRVLFRRRSDC